MYGIVYAMKSNTKICPPCPPHSTTTTSQCFDSQRVRGQGSNDEGKEQMTNDPRPPPQTPLFPRGKRRHSRTIRVLVHHVCVVRACVASFCQMSHVVSRSSFAARRRRGVFSISRAPRVGGEVSRKTSHFFYKYDMMRLHEVSCFNETGRGSCRRGWLSFRPRSWGAGLA